MKHQPLKVDRKPVVPFQLRPVSGNPAELVKLVETPLSKAEYDQMLSARSFSDTPVHSLSVPDIVELHFQLSLYAFGAADVADQRGLVLVRHGGWKISRAGQISIRCRYVPLIGNESCFPATVAALVKRYDWSKEIVICAPAKNGAGRCLLTTGLQHAAYPETIYQRFLSDMADENYEPGDVLMVKGYPPGSGTYVCLAKDGDIVRLQELREGKGGKILGYTSKCVEVNSRQCEITPLDMRLDVTQAL